MSSTGETYKPTEHGGLKEDGTPDKRVQQDSFAHGKVDPVEAGKKGGASSGSGSGGATQAGGEKYKPSEHGGLKEDGTPDKRVQQTEFAHGQVDPVEAGRKGGSK